jgi:hypothetical protein
MESTQTVLRKNGEELTKLTARARSGIRGFLGPNSNEYKQAGACGAHQRAQEAHAQSEVVISRAVGRNKISPKAKRVRGDLLLIR